MCPASGAPAAAAVAQERRGPRLARGEARRGDAARSGQRALHREGHGARGHARQRAERLDDDALVAVE